MAELAGVVTEAVADVAEGVALEALNVAEVSRSLIVRDLGIGFVVGSAVTGGLSFWLLRKVLEKKYIQIAEDEIAEMREHFRNRANIEDKFDKIERDKRDRIERDKPDLDKIVEERGYVPPPPGGLNVPTQEEVPNETKSRALDDIFRNEREDRINYADPKTRMIEREEQLAKQGWNYEAELASRSPDRPYVIHEDEFKEKDYTPVSLTFYEGDDVLCDDANMPVDNKDQLAGDDNLAKFGHGSNSPYVVFIRNDTLSLDMEIVRVSGRFVDEIQGLKHSDRRRSPRRVRFEDET